MMRRRTGISQFQWVSTYRFAVKKKFYLYVYYCQRIVLNKSLVLKLGAFIICTDEVRKPGLSQNADCLGVEEPEAGSE